MVRDHKMNISGIANCVWVLSVVSLLVGSVQGRRSFAAVKKPDPKNAAATARWLVSQNSWGVLNTLSAELGGAPFGNVVSFSDGEPGKGAGVPYFYLTTLDPTAQNALKDQRSSFTISEYPLGTCGKADPENPTCAKITLTGKLISVDEKSKEAESARNALFAKHPEMKGWPKGHDFQVYKLVIKDIFLIDWFGGPKPLTVDEYLKTKIASAKCLTLLTLKRLSSSSSASPSSIVFSLPFVHEMLPLSSSFPLKPLTSPIFPFPITPFLPTNRPIGKTFVRCSLPSPQSRTLPQTAIQRIADKLRSLGFSEDDSSSSVSNRQTKNSSSNPGEIFIPLPNALPKHRVGHTLDPSWSTPENPVPTPGSGNSIIRYHELRRVARKEKWEKMKEERGKGKIPTLAELNLPPSERRRLTTIGIAEKRKLKVGKAGITEGIVNGIHERWRQAEVVKIVCEDLCKLNMKRTHDLLERKTGGLVVWRSGSKIVLYRGANYKYPYFLEDNESNDDGETKEKLSPVMDGSSGGKTAPANTVQRKIVQGVGVPERVRFQLPGEAQLEEEADRLLEGLGPRFTDWWGYDPLPIDADLLPAVVPGYRRPFRLLPYGIQAKLTNDEMTTLKRLGRPLPCHFALGRNRKHQGLAAAIVKLWEKCEIAKIAVKRGVQNTNSELMAEELKWLTGGVLLSRDREFIVLYRGKDFLPAAVSSAISERRRRPGIHGDGPKIVQSTLRLDESPKEELENETDDGGAPSDQRNYVPQRQKQRSTEAAMKKTSVKIAVTLEKKAKAEKLLAELEGAEEPKQPEVDIEGISEEERYMLRKIGLRMKPFLLLGRRGVFDGTVENMHLHWKYRELVKLICKERDFETAQQVAKTLEAESGGILVALERVSKGHAIIVYRGKNYKRPASLRPQTLLSKREAMKRSLEAQRRESLKLHVLKLTRNIEDLKDNMFKNMEEAQGLDSLDSSRCEVKEELNVESDYPDQQSELVILDHSEENEVKADLNMGSDNPDQQSELVILDHSEENNEMMEKRGSDSNFLSLTDGLDVLSDGISTQQAIQNEVSPTVSLVETARSDPESLFQSSDEHAQGRQLSATTDRAVNSTPSHVSFMSERSHFTPSVRLDHTPSSADCSVGQNLKDSQTGTAASSVVKGKNEMMPSSRVQLSNRDRLILRKQALKMKNRPVLSVGKSNILSGVVKTIKAHFQRYPLAIVNVKGRAKGTSVQEVVFQLEQETGAVLVSQEPSKVILYRGWGAEAEAGAVDKKKHKKKSQPSQRIGDVSDDGVSKETRPAISLELMKAIRLECGLLDSKQKHNSYI
ncbi:unnamed protein product [Linum tenue]|uniref:CRM domain-containing protein n=2 Tax=Linum tenue TaxID=586396 RepID=A0AAV0NAR1_9ROSI|nr:unnamed protein product [Linum tenue]